MNQQHLPLVWDNTPAELQQLQMTNIHAFSDTNNLQLVIDPNTSAFNLLHSPAVNPGPPKFAMSNPPLTATHPQLTRLLMGKSPLLAQRLRQHSWLDVEVAGWRLLAEAADQLLHWWRPEGTKDEVSGFSDIEKRPKVDIARDVVKNDTHEIKI